MFFFSKDEKGLVPYRTNPSTPCIEEWNALGNCSICCGLFSLGKKKEDAKDLRLNENRLNLLRDTVSDTHSSQLTAVERYI